MGDADLLARFASQQRPQLECGNDRNSCGRLSQFSSGRTAFYIGSNHANVAG